MTSVVIYGILIHFGNANLYITRAYLYKIPCIFPEFMSLYLNNLREMYGRERSNAKGEGR